MPDAKQPVPSRPVKPGETEFTGLMDEDKTVPIEPRPLRSARSRIRAQNLTGDPTGQSPTDGGYAWNGLDRNKWKGRKLLPEQNP